jgi:hypothetical protein
MKNLVQIIYISRSTFVPSESSTGIEPNVARILHKSRSNNVKNGLVGVLYFGNGCFFQCLEGEEAAIDTLYKKLEADPRHQDIRLLSRKRIAAQSFGNWAMKYVPIDQAMQKLLLDNGYANFDPYTFDENMTQKVIALLMTASDSESATAPLGANAMHTPQPGTKSAGISVKLALVFSLASFLLSLAAIYLAAR